MRPAPDDVDDLVSPPNIAWALGGLALGVALALWALPNLAPAAAQSLIASQPRAWWYLSRTSGLASYALLVVSMLAGLLLSTRFAKEWPGSPTALALHQHASLLALAFGLFHALVLLGDRHTPFGALEILLPFGAAYRPLAVGAGQLALYGTGLLVASFYVRKHIGPRAWRSLHFLSFAVFGGATYHGVATGTDRAPLLVTVAPVVGTLVLVVYRLLASVIEVAPTRAASRPSPREQG